MSLKERQMEGCIQELQDIAESRSKRLKSLEDRIKLLEASSPIPSPICFYDGKSVKRIDFSHLGENLFHLTLTLQNEEKIECGYFKELI